MPERQIRLFCFVVFFSLITNLFLGEGGTPLTQHHDHCACADGGHAVRCQALPASVVVFTEWLQQQGTISQLGVLGARGRANL